ncbi:MAG: TIGR00730 family Rossman fold protein, partial [Phycisphaerae bacterium]|nr:TIGR00730 family Rossman fold protein [Phycisphaerae bacterium]
ANAALGAGGRVIGVVPEAIAAKVGHRGLSEIHVVATMHDRKRVMFELSDAFIALPGGMGTLEELTEVLTWAQLGMHAKPVGLLNVAGYYDHLLRFLDHAVEQKFIKPAHRRLLHVAGDGPAMLEQFRRFVPPRIEKWFDGIPRGPVAGQ